MSRKCDIKPAVRRYFKETREKKSRKKKLNTVVQTTEEKEKSEREINNKSELSDTFTCTLSAEPKPNVYLHTSVHTH